LLPVVGAASLASIHSVNGMRSVETLAGQRMEDGSRELMTFVSCLRLRIENSFMCTALTSHSLFALGINADRRI
jgi:hypothetical protein